MISHTALFWFLIVIASIVAEHYTGNILYKGNQFNTKVDYFLGVDRDWIECKDRQLWVEIAKTCRTAEESRTKLTYTCTLVT